MLVQEGLSAYLLCTSPLLKWPSHPQKCCILRPVSNSSEIQMYLPPFLFLLGSVLCCWAKDGDSKGLDISWITYLRFNQRFKKKTKNRTWMSLKSQCRNRNFRRVASYWRRRWESCGQGSLGAFPNLLCRWAPRISVWPQHTWLQVDGALWGRE